MTATQYDYLPRCGASTTPRNAGAGERPLLRLRDVVAFSRRQIAVGVALAHSYSLRGRCAGFDGAKTTISSSSDDIRSSATFTVTGETRVIAGEERGFLSEATVGS